MQENQQHSTVLKVVKAPPESSFRHWLAYYKNNQGHMNNINWQLGESLSLQELHAIESSLQQFQKGESSEGHNLMKYARGFNNEEYLETIRYFIREEQRHALVLGKFMDLHAIPKIKEHWVDNVFRSLRKSASLETSIIVLLTAEIIAAVYYKALMAATGSKLLKQLCTQILDDEEMHINFQSYTLSQFHSRKKYLMKFFSRKVHAVLLSGTVAVVWLYHGRTLKAGGYRLGQFIKETFAEFRRANNMICGKAIIPIREPRTYPLKVAYSSNPLIINH